MNLRNIVHINKADRQKIACLLAITIAGAAVFYISRDKEPGGDNDVATAVAEGDSKEEGSGKQKYYAAAEKEVRLQAFDPNTADSTLLLSLGLQPWQVRSIYKYRAAGGVYTRPEDFARLYGLSVKKYRELKPYISISPDYREASTLAESRSHRQQDTYDRTSPDPAATTAQAHSEQFPQKLKAGQTLALNSADTLSLRRIPGIGPYFARKIVRYRERLGGFVSKKQLLEIQDFPESALDYINLPESETNRIRKLNINKATSEQLRSHPYISYVMARSILDFRRMRGNITNLSDLRLMPSFTPEAIAKIRPYIEY